MELNFSAYLIDIEIFSKTLFEKNKDIIINKNVIDNTINIKYCRLYIIHDSNYLNFKPWQTYY